LCGKGLEALEGLKWDGHELLSLDISFIRCNSLEGGRGFGLLFKD